MRAHRGDSGTAAAREALFPSEHEAQAFARATGARWVGARLRYLEKTDSTNVRARRLADLGWPDGTVVVADWQEAGRGRAGRRWMCPARAGLLVSVCLPRPGDASPAWLTAAGALALVDAVDEACGLELLVEWPNDIVAPDAGAPGGRRKVGGILVEARGPSPVAGPPGDAAPGRTGAVVLGSGLNVDVREEEFPPELRAGAGSLLSVFGTSPDRRGIFGSFLVALESRVDGSGGLAGELRARSFTLGREVEVPAVAPGEGPRTGRAVGFDDEMRLVVELPGGATETVAFRAAPPGASAGDRRLGETA